MESKRKIVNGETMVDCEFSINELALMCNALNRLYCQTDEKRLISQFPEAYDEKCDKIIAILEKVQDLVIE